MYSVIAIENYLIMILLKHWTPVSKFQSPISIITVFSNKLFVSISIRSKFDVIPAVLVVDEASIPVIIISALTAVAPAS